MITITTTTRSILIIVALLMLNPVIAQGETVAITLIKSGKAIKITPLSVNEKTVTFKLNGKKFTVALDTLTLESRKDLTSWNEASKKKLGDAVEKINKAIGHKFFDPSKTLWDEPTASVAKRLSWPRESSTETSSSYRYYPASSYGFTNAHPYCCTLYGGEDGKTSHLSLVFANKGDYGSTVGRGEDHFKPQGNLPSATNLNQAIELDAKAISQALTGALGDAIEQRYGEKEDRRKVKRWDYGEHAFILSQREGEYTHLLVVSTENADKGGKVNFVKDQELRAQLATNIITKDNGDVHIKNIPMVDQGPKGYCAPATFERAMRYMLVPADMYLLATLATKAGGGTNTRLLAEESKRIIRSKARRIKDLELNKDLSMRLVSKYVDKGVPILWQMSSLSKYNKIANSRTAARTKITDFTQWTKDIASEAKSTLPSLHNNSNHHICMIIGYNKKTNELAVSDSWGPRYKIRWIHIDIAKAVSSQGGFVIDL